MSVIEFHVQVGDANPQVEASPLSKIAKALKEEKSPLEKACKKVSQYFRGVYNVPRRLLAKVMGFPTGDDAESRAGFAAAAMAFLHEHAELCTQFHKGTPPADNVVISFESHPVPYLVMWARRIVGKAAKQPIGVTLDGISNAANVILEALTAFSWVAETPYAHHFDELACAMVLALESKIGASDAASILMTRDAVLACQLGRGCSEVVTEAAALVPAPVHPVEVKDTNVENIRLEAVFRDLGVDLTLGEAAAVLNGLTLEAARPLLARIQVD